MCTQYVCSRAAVDTQREAEELEIISVNMKDFSSERQVEMIQEGVGGQAELVSVPLLNLRRIKGIAAVFLF